MKRGVILKMCISEEMAVPENENGIKMEQDLIVLAKEWGLNVYIDSQSDKKVEKGSKKRSNA